MIHFVEQMALLLIYYAIIAHAGASVGGAIVSYIQRFAPSFMQIKKFSMAEDWEFLRDLSYEDFIETVYGEHPNY